MHTHTHPTPGPTHPHPHTHTHSHSHTHTSSEEGVPCGGVCDHGRMRCEVSLGVACLHAQAGARPEEGTAPGQMRAQLGLSGYSGRATHTTGQEEGWAHDVHNAPRVSARARKWGEGGGKACPFLLHNRVDIRLPRCMHTTPRAKTGRREGGNGGSGE